MLGKVTITLPYKGRLRVTILVLKFRRKGRGNSYGLRVLLDVVIDSNQLTAEIPYETTANSGNVEM